MADDTRPPEAVAEAAASPPLRRRRRWPWGLLAGVVALALLAPAGLWWAFKHQPAALPWLLLRIPGLSVEGVQGTPGSGQIQVRQLSWQAPAAPGQVAQGGRLAITGLAVELAPLGWRPYPGAWVSLHLPRVTADRVAWRSSTDAGGALQAPASLRLPLTIQIDQLLVRQLVIDDQPAITGLTARLGLGLAQGARHRVDDLALAWQGSGLAGSAQIESTAPLAVQAVLAAQRNGTAPWAALLRLQGPLARLDATLALAGRPAGAARPPALTARAQLLPFERWPLGTLSLATEALDLSALLPGWPQTALSGQAQVQSSGLDQPASARITLANALPGAWDQHRLPLSQLALTARGKPQPADPLSIDQMEAQLAGAAGPAGRVSGQGRWQHGQLTLDLAIADLQPARLHQQAAALLLSGPVQLQISGLAPVATTVAPIAAASGGALAPAAPAPARAPWQAQVKARLAGRSLDGSGLPITLAVAATGNAQHLQITEARAQAGDASAQATLDARAEPAGWRLAGQARLTRFDPRPWWRGADASAWRLGPHRLDASADVKLLWRHPAWPAAGQQAAIAGGLPLWAEQALAVLDGDARLQIQDSLVAGVPLAASLHLQRTPQASTVDLQAVLAGNRLTAQGRRATPSAADEWRLQWQLPDLAALAPLGRLAAEGWPALATRWPDAGALSGDASATGRWPAWRTQGDVQALGLRAGSLALQSAQLNWSTGDSADAALSLQLRASGLADGDRRLDALSAGVTGSLRQHTLDLQLDSPAKPPSWTENLLGPAGTGTRLQLKGQGQWLAGGTDSRAAQASARPPGSWRLQALQVQGGARDKQGGSRPWLAAQGLSAELQLGSQWQPVALHLAPGRLQLLDTALRWQDARWTAATTDQPARLDLVAELERFDVAALLARAQPTQGWGGKLTLGGRIDVHSSGRFDADLVLERLAGDLTLTDDLGVTQPLGVTDLRLALSAHDGLWQFAQGAAGSSLGEMAGAQVLRTSADRLWPPADAPLQGVIEARVANLGIWGTWVPPGWRLAGKLRTSASFSGTRGAPEVRGEMVGSGLGVRNLLQGVNVSDGELALTLSGETARIERLRFKGGDGQLTLTGQATLGAKPGATLALQAERFRLLGRIDRRLVASGQATLVLDAQQLRMDGGFSIDEGLIDLSHGDAPTLDADVQVRRGGNSPLPGAEPAGVSALPAPLRQPQVHLKIGLGQQLRLRGHGVDTGLRGELAVTSPDGRLALHGTVRTEGGTVAAYGQKLEIERGAVSFNGALDNPLLDVLAIRPNLDVRVGVMVTGAVQKPRIRLISEPELADYDKLSWLVLGRSPDGLGRTDTALLQRAALALLSGEGRSPTDALLENIGLTDFSVRQSDGDTRETIVSLGKQLSRRWYLGYERSVNATTGTWQLIYRIAQRFTLRAQSGTDNAVDVIWSWRW